MTDKNPETERTADIVPVEETPPTVVSTTVPIGLGHSTTSVIPNQGNGGTCTPTCLGITALCLAVAGLLCFFIPGARLYRCSITLVDDDDYYYYDNTYDGADCFLIFPIILTFTGLSLLIASCVVCCCWCGNCAAGSRSNGPIIVQHS